MANIERVFPDIPPFETLRLYFSQPLEVCPTSLLDPYFMFLLASEQSAREYHVLPFDGGYWDQPLLLSTIFDVIRTERNQYERIRFEKAKKKGTQTPSTPGMLSGKAIRDIAVSPNASLPPRTS